MELYESMEEGKEHMTKQQRAILDNIKEQAFYNYQIGLHDKIKLVVHAQRYKTLQEAMIDASAEEKVKGPSHGIERSIRTRKETAIRLYCQKCGKAGHRG